MCVSVEVWKKAAPRRRASGSGAIDLESPCSWLVFADVLPLPLAAFSQN